MIEHPVSLIPSLQVEFAFNDYNDADRTLGDWNNFARRCVSLKTT